MILLKLGNYELSIYTICYSLYVRKIGNLVTGSRTQLKFALKRHFCNHNRIGYIRSVHGVHSVFRF